MPWNGSGVFNRIYSWVADKAAGLDISSTRMDTDTNDIVTSGFGNCITRDGQGQPTANLPMAGFRHTGVANGVNRTDYASLNQAQDGLIGWTIAGGTADAITATYTPSAGALSDGLLRAFRATAANATTTPTFAPDSQPAHTITRMGGAALAGGDIPGNLAESWVRYNLANTRWELLNPAQPAANPTITGTSAMTVPSGTTGQRPGSPVASDIRFNSSTVAFEGYDGTAWRNLNAPNGGAPQISQLTASSGTYTTPTGALYLIVELQAGGGGGGGNGTGAATGGNGGGTSLGSIVANGGAGGSAATTTNGQPGGNGGSGGTGSAARWPGGSGNPGGNVVGADGAEGGAGGSGFFGGAGSAGTTTINPGAGQAQSGGGGGGAGSPNTSFGGGGGGGAGEYARSVISGTLAATYSYSVGVGGGAGAAGTSGASGSAGGSGVIVVTAYFQ